MMFFSIFMFPIVQSKLHVDFIRQGKATVAYCPSIDLSSSGKDLKQARGRFMEAAELFFEELLNSGTLEEVLKDLGWMKIKHHWRAPKIVSQESLDFTVPVVA